MEQVSEVQAPSEGRGEMWKSEITEIFAVRSVCSLTINREVCRDS